MLTHHPHRVPFLKRQGRIGDVEAAVRLFNSRHKAVPDAAEAVLVDALPFERGLRADGKPPQDHFLLCEVLRGFGLRSVKCLYEGVQPGIRAYDLDAVQREDAVLGRGRIDALPSPQDGDHLHAVAPAEIQFPELPACPFGLPGDVEIGKVKVVDTGFSLHGSFNQVMQKAINATAEKGGNGLVITEHRWPDGRSTIHRLWGTMLHIPESAFAESETPDTMEYSALKQILTEDEYAEFMEYRATKQFYEEQEKEYEERMKLQQELIDQAPRNVLRLSVGPSLMTSKYQVDNHQYKNRVGFDLCVDYDHLWKSGFGIGINYLYNYTSFDEGVKSRINYIGPSLVLAPAIKKSFRYDIAFGIGYCHYSDSYEGESETQNRLGVMMRVGAEWKVAKSLALGAQISYISVRMKKPEGLELEKNEFYGITHFGLQAGLRYYF